MSLPNGWVAEWLCSGLQSRGRRVDSALSLHVLLYFSNFTLSNSLALFGPGGEIGRRKGLKIPRLNGRAGSTPAPGTNF